MNTRITLDANELFALHFFLNEYVPLFATNRDIVSAQKKISKATHFKEPELPPIKEKGDFRMEGNTIWL